MNQKVKYKENGFFIKEQWYDLEDIKQKYLFQNMSQVDMCHFLGINRGLLTTIINHYQLFKDKQLVKNNRIQGIVNKYGVDSVMKLAKYQQKSQQAIMDKYGYKSPLCNPDCNAKAKQTMVQRYGVEQPSCSTHIINKRKENYYKKHGVYSHCQQNINNFEIWSDNTKLESFLNSLCEKPSYTELANYFAVDRTAVNNKILSLGLEDLIDTHPGHSAYEEEIVKFLEENNIVNYKRNSREELGGKEIDIYLPDYKLGIEFNGNYWHSDIYKTDHCGRSLYHQEKSLLAETKGIFLFHIFEYEWDDPVKRENIKSRLKAILGVNAIKIPARNCNVVELTKKQKKEFLDKNHIQKNDHSTKQFGLIYKNELVACMTFVHPKNNKYTWELTRFCNKHNCVVQGGASKLFKYFVNSLNIGDTISSYNDITKTKGTLYKNLGFNCVSINPPNYIWFNFDSGDIRSRYQEQAAGENKRMQQAGYHKICDCGTKTWVYKKDC